MLREISMAICPEVRTTRGYASWGKVVQVPAAACMAGCLEWVLDVFCAMITILPFIQGIFYSRDILACKLH